MKELEIKNYNDLMELIQKENNINDFFKIVLTGEIYEKL